MTPVMIATDQMELPMAVLLRRMSDEGTMPGRRRSIGGRLAVPEGKQQYGRVRSDSLPEQTRYRDDGCEVNPSCLTCPLPRCRYEEPGGLRGMINGYRDRQIVESRLNGEPVETLAVRYRLSRRTIFRILVSNGVQGREARCA